MKKSMRRLFALAVCVLAVAVAAGCGSSKKSSSTTTNASGGGGGGKIQACALLPDTKSSTRYTLFDAPYLKEAFANANVPAQVLNALNDSQKQKSQAQQCLAKGAKVILLDQINAASGNAITNLAVQQHAKVIDYDRLVVGSKAAYYVSFDNVGVGKLQGKGLVDALKACSSRATTRS
ncbi:MAG TPA: substrate-binding domain-containing protein [Gaiellaceae bacterium]|nr:substrate-binding domain-containing protein [Gaiellaceae bacterium]